MLDTKIQHFCALDSRTVGLWRCLEAVWIQMSSKCLNHKILVVEKGHLQFKSYYSTTKIWQGANSVIEILSTEKEFAQMPLATLERFPYCYLRAEGLIQ